MLNEKEWELMEKEGDNSDLENPFLQDIKTPEQEIPKKVKQSLKDKLKQKQAELKVKAMQKREALKENPKFQQLTKKLNKKQ